MTTWFRTETPERWFNAFSEIMDNKECTLMSPLVTKTAAGHLTHDSRYKAVKVRKLMDTRVIDLDLYSLYSIRFFFPDQNDPVSPSLSCSAAT